MLNEKFFSELREDHKANEVERKTIIEASNNILHASKRAIFSIHRGEMDKAKDSLGELEKGLLDLEKKYSFQRLSKEGSYKAGVEEYVEARGLYNLVTGEKLDKFDGLTISFDSYLAGFCDITGELVRLAISKASSGDMEEVAKLKQILEDIMAELVEFDMAGYLRTKYDQARHSVRKMEQIQYEISMRK